MAAAVKNDPKVIFGWALYDWANSSYIVTTGAIIGVFFASTIVPEEGFLGFDGETLWGAVVSMGAFALFLAMPVLGAIADFSGSKRRFLQISAYTGAVFTMLVPFVPDGAVPWFLALFLVSYIGFASGNVFYDGFLPDITTDATIDKVSSRGYALGYVGGGIYLLLAMVVILLSDDGGATGLSTSGATRLAIFGAGAWWLAFTLVAMRRLPETGVAAGLPAGSGGGWSAYARVGFARTIATGRKLLGFRQLLLFVLAFVFYNDGIQTVISMAGPFASETLDLDITVIGIAFLVVQFIAFFGALAFGVLSSRLGTKGAIMVALAAWTLLAVAGYLIPAGSPGLFLGLACCIGFVLGGAQALSRSLYGSMIPEEASAEFFGFFSVLSKFSAIWGPLVFAVVSNRTGSGRPAILSIAAFFAVGMILLSRVDIAEARRSRDRWTFEEGESGLGAPLPGSRQNPG